MGKPFVAYLESEPQSPVSSHDVSSQNGKLDSAGATLLTESAPPQDALQAAESYFQQVRNSSSRNSNGSHGPPRTLFESLQDETQEPTGFVPTPHRKSIGEVLQMNSSKLPVEVTSRASPGQWDIDLEASPSEFSLDDSDTSRNESMFLPPAELGSTISPAQANSDLETPSEFSLEDSDTSPDESMCSLQMGSGSDRVLPENEMIVQGLNFANVGVSSQSLDAGSFQSRGESGQQGEVNSSESVSEQEDSQIEEVEEHVQDTVSKSDFEWRGVLRRSGRSLDSISHDSFKTRISSANPRYSLSDEAISERTAAWGNGVAGLVLKNSSRESTPRTSTGSSVDGQIQLYGQKVPGVSKHVKDALTSFRLAFVVCDVIDPEKPVLFASAGFFDMTGYSPEEVIGRNCRFLQGVDTDAKEVARISTALKKGESYSGTILNYKKNGSPFWNLLTLSPINDDKGVVIKYMGMQAEVKSNSMMARQKKKAFDTNCKDIPRLMSMVEETSQPTSQSKRSERGDDVPIFTLPSTSRVTVTHDSNGRSQGSKRYSLTYGIHDRRSRSVEFGPGRPIAGSERYSMPSERKRSLAPQQRPAKSTSARPFYWLLTAARILEEEFHQLGSGNQKFEDHTETTLTRPEERKGGRKKKNKISRVAKGLFGLFRKLERKVFKRTSIAPSNRVNAYEPESDSDIDDFQDIGKINDFGYEQQYPGCESMPRINSTLCDSMPHINSARSTRCDSMPHINSARGGSASNLVKQAELRTRSNRYFPSSTSDRFPRRTSAANTNEFVLDRKQFCIVHE